MAETRDEHNPKGWTFSAFETYVDNRFVTSEEAVKTAMSAAEKATIKAETAADKRFDSVNEFREAMKDQQNKFADKDQSDFRLGALDKRLNQLENAQAATTAKGQGVWLIAVIVAQGLLIGIALAAFFKH
jgi:anion-transporting  ArsA/GET3 family ATPase